MQNKLISSPTFYFERALLYILCGLLSFFYGIVASFSLLGFFRINVPWLIIFVIILLSVLAFYLFIKWINHGGWEWTDRNLFKLDKIIQWALWLSSGLMLLFLILLPIIRWPLSTAGDLFPWDAGAYHFPKAVELFKTGSIWDLSISYGDYPFGYEALLAFELLLFGGVQEFGVIHTIIILFFILSFWLLAKKITSLPSSLLFFLIIPVLLSDTYFQTFNLWRVFTLDIYTVGKNDILLAGALLVFLLFFYQLLKNSRVLLSWFTFGISSMFALSIKPNALYLVLTLWGYLIFRYKAEWRKYFLCFLISIPGIIWIIRNYISIGSLFHPLTLELTKKSIAVQFIENPDFTLLPKILLIITLVVIVFNILALVKKSKYCKYSLVALILFISFLITPATAYSAPDFEIGWRFAETLLAFILVILLVLVRKGIKNIFSAISFYYWNYRHKRIHFLAVERKDRN